MPSRVVEIVLITLILFFVYLFSIRFFTSFPVSLYYEKFLSTYLKNNVILCTTLGSLYFGRVYCYSFFESRVYGKGVVDARGDIIYVTFGRQIEYLNISRVSFLKNVYGISTANFYLYNNINNLTIVYS